MNSVFHPLDSLRLIIRFVGKIFPQVHNELMQWRTFAATHGCPELSAQALSSIRTKTFHCQGGSIYALYPGVDSANFIRLVVALQTISDYLDNLCDRAGVVDAQAFRQLHLAMTDALDPQAVPHDYYCSYPFQDDGGYLPSLVLACQQEVAKLPSYHMIKPALLRFATLYSELQTYKHLQPHVRECKMDEWVRNHIAGYPEITIWEFAAATGSTLGMFALCAAASNPLLDQMTANTIARSYFPWICGLHILLDYFIDRQEDLLGGDLNFVAYYQSAQETLDRLVLFTEKSLEKAAGTPYPLFTYTVIYGLLGMYLSDPKTSSPQEKAIKNKLLHSAGWFAKVVYGLCNLVRALKLL